MIFFGIVFVLYLGLDILQYEASAFKGAQTYFQKFFSDRSDIGSSAILSKMAFLSFLRYYGIL